jgi:hypothetical protein
MQSKSIHQYWAKMALIILPISTAYADTNYDSSATILYTLNSVSNTNPGNPNDLSTLSITAAFQQLTDTADFYAYTTGDGAYLSNTPDIPATLLTANSFNSTFAVSGDSANYGAIQTENSGLFSLNFTDTGTDSYTIDVTLSYVLTAIAQGLYANSAIFLDYWDSNNNLSGADYIGAGTYPGYSNDNENQPGNAELVFTLTPGSTNSFYAQVAISSVLDTTSNSATTLPIPSGSGLFLSGLAAWFIRRTSRA